MFPKFDDFTRQMLSGNIWLIVCCAFYLAWWLIAFNPDHAVKGLKSGWLLIPAFVFGVLAVLRIVGGSSVENTETLMFPRYAAVIGGVIVYIVLLAATFILLKRQVTTELFLIVGWGALMFVELNALYGLGYYSQGTVIALLVVSVVLAAVSIVCYLLYYNLDSVKGYIDGMVPLLIVMVMMAAVTVSVAVKK